MWVIIKIFLRRPPSFLRLHQGEYESNSFWGVLYNLFLGFQHICGILGGWACWMNNNRIRKRSGEKWKRILSRYVGEREFASVAKKISGSLTEVYLGETISSQVYETT